MVPLEPRRLVRGDPKGKGVGVGEHIVPVELGEDAPGPFLRNPTRQRPLLELVPVVFEERLLVLPGEEAAELVGLAGAEARHVDG